MTLEADKGETIVKNLGLFSFEANINAELQHNIWGNK